MNLCKGLGLTSITCPKSPKTNTVLQWFIPNNCSLNLKKKKKVVLVGGLKGAAAGTASRIRQVVPEM